MSKLFTAALGLAVAVLPVLGVGFAAADDDLSCDAAKTAVVKAQARVDDRAAQERIDENKLVDEAQRVRDAAKKALDTLLGDDIDNATQDIAGARRTLEDAKTVLQSRKDDRNSDSKRLAELRVLLTAAISDRDEACSEPTTTPPTPTPAPTTTPAPAAEFPVDLDCSDLSDQEAQKVLDADKSDPHNLDSDEDGFACDEVDNPVSNDTVVIPSGGVNTGGGPA
jgi:hypothetical protein